MAPDPPLSDLDAPASVSRPNLQDEVVKRIRTDIFAGRLKPGERINQDQLAESMEISRLPIREALIALEREGLVRIVPRRGAFVWMLRPEDIGDQYEVYGVVSGMATERAAEALSEEDLDALRTLIDRMDGESDARGLEQLNARFHGIINRGSGSPRLTWLLGLLASSVPVSYHDEGGWELGAEDHRLIVDRLAARDRKGAGDAMRAHIHKTGELALEALGRAGLW
jgi:DNA-binding GntR family transcriptional regulator